MKGCGSFWLVGVEESKASSIFSPPLVLFLTADPDTFGILKGSLNSDDSVEVHRNNETFSGLVIELLNNLI